MKSAPQWTAGLWGPGTFLFLGTKALFNHIFSSLLSYQLQELLVALAAASQAPSGESAYKQIEQMVDRLEDPYTRIVPPR